MKHQNDPLAILREDTYSNEEINAQAGEIAREKQTGNWTCTHRKDIDRIDYDFENGFKVIHDRKHHRIYTECLGIAVASMPPISDSISVDEFNEILIGIEKLQSVQPLNGRTPLQTAL